MMTLDSQNHSTINTHNSTEMTNELTQGSSWYNQHGTICHRLYIVALQSQGYDPSHWKYTDSTKNWRYSSEIYLYYL